MKCPYCESEDCKKVSLVFEAGTSAGSFAGVGAGAAGYSGGSALGGGVSVGNTVDQTLLAQRVAPPAKPDASYTVAGGIVTFIALLYIFNGVSAGVMGGVAALSCLFAILAGLVYLERQKSYPKLLARWQDLWMCLRCGRQWKIGADGAPIKPPEADGDILQLVRQGKKLAAIRLYRDRTGVGLKDATDYVDSLLG